MGLMRKSGKLIIRVECWTMVWPIASAHYKFSINAVSLRTMLVDFKGAFHSQTTSPRSRVETESLNARTVARRWGPWEDTEMHSEKFLA